MSSSNEIPDYDVVIVGARCAGAATARLLAQTGMRVLVLDRMSPGADTVSTSYLMRGAVLQLHRWGVLPRLVEAGTPGVSTTRFHYETHSVEIPIRAADGVSALYAPRRTVLDPLVVAAATAAGAEVRFGARARGLVRRTDGRVAGVHVEEERGALRTIRATWVIGADGASSTVADLVGSPRYSEGRHAGPTIYGYFEGFEAKTYDWYYAHGMSAGTAPTNHGAATVFVAAPPERVPDLHGDRIGAMLRLARTLSPDLAEAIADARPVGPLRAYRGMRGYYRKPWGPGWALVGDAGYFRDPATAYGISDAFRDAELLSRALATGTESALQAYHFTRDAVTRRLFTASDEIASGEWDEPRIGALLREASEGMREGVSAIQGLDAGARQRGDAPRAA